MADPRPLDGIRILDLTQYVSGPFATMILADLGAEVIKVERPDGGDVYRRQGPEFLDAESVSFLALNRNKKSVSIDLSTPEGQSLGQRLLSTCDVVVQNLRPGTAQRLGLGRDEVHRIAPDTIWASLSGYGEVGPKGNDGGYDLMVQGETGLMEMTGHADRPPAKAGVAVIDVAAGTNLALGILAALLDRARNGRTASVETSLYETGMAMTVIQAERYLNLGHVAARAGSASSLFAPYEAYLTADGYVTVEGTGPLDAWSRFCEALGVTGLVVDPRFVDNASRLRNVDALREIVEERTFRESTQFWEKAFRDHGLPCGPILGLGAALDSDQTEALNIVIDVPHDTLGSYRSVRGALRYDTRALPSRGAPTLGQHTGEVLRTLDVSADDLRLLDNAGVIRIGIQQ